MTIPDMNIETSPSRLLAAVANGVEVYDLGRPYEVGMPQSPNHPAYWRTLPRRHGDMRRADGGSAANDLIVMGTHVGTHVDALAHVSHDGRLHGDADAVSAQEGGAFLQHGVHTIRPMFVRGVLFDVPAARGEECCAPAYEIIPADLQACMDRQGTSLTPGDVALIRSGWGQRWPDGDAYLGRETGVPGPGEEAAHWLADQQVLAAGADTIAFEHLPAETGHAVLPAHRVLLVESGIYIIETLALEELARDGVYEFLFVLSPLLFVGATGSPVRPLAVVERK